MFIQFGGVILAFTGKNIKPYIGSLIPDNILDWIEGNKYTSPLPSARRGCFSLLTGKLCPLRCPSKLLTEASS